MRYSIVVPVYNRPEEIREFLESLTRQDFAEPFEVVIVEDGSSVPCWSVVQKYFERLRISYFTKPNSGPGDSRNFGMAKADGDYFLIFDSDCLLPETYLSEVDAALRRQFSDCFGGRDAALKSFSPVQKAINFAMTSFLTTGGIRGGSESLGRFQPRSFNMGLSRKAFEASGGFGNIHPGEDPDLSMRLWRLGFETRLIPQAFVYHKRRIDWKKFYVQVHKFGKARPILDTWFPEYAKKTFWLPTLFLAGAALAVVFLLFGWKLPFVTLVVYFALAFVLATVSEKNPYIGMLAVAAIAVQFYGYGIGYLKSTVLVKWKGMEPQHAFPELFFKR